MTAGLLAARRGGIDPVHSLLSRAEAMWKAAGYSGSGNLLDLTGHGHDLVITGAAFSVDHFTFVAGESDYMTAADHADLDFAATDSFTIAIAMAASAPAAACLWMAKRDGTSTSAGKVGWMLQSATSATSVTFRCDDAAAIASASKTTALDGNPALYVGKRDVVADTLTAYKGPSAGTPAADTTTATLANAFPLRIGASSSVVPAGFSSMTFYGAAVFRHALTPAEMTTLAVELGVPA